MTCRQLRPLVVCVALAALLWPAAGAADHFIPGGNVSAAVTERTAPDVWNVDVRWAGSCQGAAADGTYYDGDLYLIEVATGARKYIGGFVPASGVRDTRQTAAARPRVLVPEMVITCYVLGPSHGAGYSVTVRGDPVTIPARLGRGGGGGAGGGDGPGSGGGGGDPTGPLRTGGCRVAVLGTNGPDTLAGTDAAEVMIGFAAADRMRGEGGHDCLVGGPGADTLSGGDGDDRLVGGPGRDNLTGGAGGNAYDAGAGNDVVRARNGRRELVVCGSGRDRAYVDRGDRVRGCELSLAGGR